MTNKVDQTISEHDREFLQIVEQRFIHIFDVFSEGLFYMDEFGTMVFYNQRFYEQFGINAGRINLDRWLDLVHPLDRERLSKRVDAHINTDNTRVTTTYRLRKPNGQYVWIEGVAMTKETEHGHYMVGSHRDISERKLMESYIHQVAFHDNASGMANRAHLLLNINELIESKSTHASIFYIQIEEIKSYLNQYGSELVDGLVEKLLQTLSHLPSSNCTVYRVHDDDFAILVLDEVPLEDLQVYAKTIKRNYHDAVVEKGQYLGSNISIGLYPCIDPEHSAEEIVRKAARTCQYANEKNKDRIAVYSQKTQYAVDRYFFIEQGLKNALEERTLSVKFQPIVSASDLQVVSFESLVRWRSKEFGEIYPDEFIPVAENKGLIVELGYQVFEKACQFIKSYRERYQNQVRVNVNVSVLQLLNSEFPSKIKAMADQVGIEPQAIVLELTETFILDNNQAAIAPLNTLRELGFSLSMDDFGAGYSSLNCFFDLPMTQIKIDKSMAWKTLTNRSSREYLKFLITMCREQNIEVVIEGIEDAKMCDFFAEMGVDYLQGYWFSKPLSVASASRYTLSQ
ncbi:putative bifunctional diguanylate cyclase/phosphodiesterase [Vibrio campbellii]|uniref:putative bifunctional diguanylate cyclase/phosphodiesterase n=1 Tax=Vibrio campbellii TaxID=680 RepID=UPI0002DDB62C|nr:EAL domain-containing protein [Vibrio campbellii]AGU93754.1 histidine kinase [Vibrio campbellii ATCC BAA-1116]MBT0123971.1 EAL domain-containing protein [Vibrio campbellii]MBT0136325.1 EAL domain-containing protein [Vibrio campbellii]MBT0140985.1 EAL domain-containing protein [Vibrio campbellii]MBT0145740.1 EAL domain-containing protein [Vibrio campbellii]